MTGPVVRKVDGNEKVVGKSASVTPTRSKIGGNEKLTLEIDGRSASVTPPLHTTMFRHTPESSLVSCVL